MAESLQQKLDQIQRKSELLVTKYNMLKAEKEGVEIKNIELEELIESLKQELEMCQEENKHLKVARVISTTEEELTKNKAILSKMVRDVDKCIAQLTD
ncbi:MAG: hypothetical protein R3Y22_02155 [Bacteroidales bacterium]